MFISLLSISALVVTSAHASPTPKMVAKVAPPGRRLVTEVPTTQKTISTVFIETCSPDSPLTIPISAGEGKGMVGLMDDDNTAADIALDFSAGDVDLDVNKQPNVFSAISDGAKDGTVGMRFTYTNVPPQGAVATLQCTQQVQIMFAYQDKSGFALEYDVTTQSSGNNQDNPVSTSQVSLLNGKAKKPLTGKALAKGQQGRHLSKNAHVRDGTDKDIGFDSNGPGDVVLLQVELEDNGKTIFRSIVAETTSAPAPAATMDLASASVNDDGDVDLYFTGVPLEHAMIQALIMVELRGQVLEDQKIELSAIVDDGHLVLHGGWIRNALDKAGVTGATHGWKLLVAEAVALDPHKSYRPVATMSGKKDSAVSKNKHLLSSAPSDKEQGISSEMRTGRRPERRRLGARNLSGNHFKILVHGYCADGNPWPTSQFTNDIVFSDPGPVRRRLGGSGGTNNWSNDEFARKIDLFAENNNIHGCGIIAHSQGGLAALHLYRNYWSCLDDAAYGGSRMIQSVGSPYRGTALAGSLAALGDVFGAGCGTQNDLTESGADAWLSYIPTWARSQVHYYTTSFEDNWWSYDYCNSFTDPFLSDPDDGVVAKSRAQLSGGNNRGHTEGWCHSTGMSDTAQYYDSGRNSVMNSNAAY